MPDNEANTGSGERDGSDAISLGERLSSARKARAISLEQAARTLHLDKTVVAALEAEQFEALGAAVFVKGHLRSYADLLGLSPDDVIEAYRQLDPAIDELPATIVKQQWSERVNVALWSFWAMVIIAALLVTVYLYEGVTDQVAGSVQQQEPAPVAESTIEPVSEAAAVMPPTATDRRSVAEPVPVPAPESVAPTPEALATAPQAAELAPEPVAPTPEALAVTPQAAEPAPEAPGFTVAEAPAIFGLSAGNPIQTRLSLIFSEDSWAEITDANGRILYGLQRAGTQRELSAEPPIGVFLGNANGVEILVDGSAYSISSRVRRNNTARFEIEPDIQP